MATTTHYVFNGQKYASMQEVQIAIQASMQAPAPFAAAGISQGQPVQYAASVGQQQAVTYGAPVGQPQQQTLMYSDAMGQQQLQQQFHQQQLQQQLQQQQLQQQQQQAFIMPQQQQQLQQQSYLPPQQQATQILQQTSYAAPIADPGAAQAVVKQEVGPWHICEDQMGEYYVYTPSGQTFDQPPAELIQCLQQNGF